MNWKNIRITALSTFLFLLILLPNLSASDSVEWTPYKTMQLDAAPIDVAISPDGRRIFVLTDQGEILIYSATSNGKVKMNVGKHVDQIKMGPGGDSLILNSNKNKTSKIGLGCDRTSNLLFYCLLKENQIGFGCDSNSNLNVQTKNKKT